MLLLLFLQVVHGNKSLSQLLKFLFILILTIKYTFQGSIYIDDKTHLNSSMRKLNAYNKSCVHYSLSKGNIHCLSNV